MLSKLFFQDVVFGVIITTFHLSAIVKQQSTLCLYRTKKFLTTFKDGKRILNTDSSNEMCTFIYSVLKWSVKEKCMLNC